MMLMSVFIIVTSPQHFHLAGGNAAAAAAAPLHPAQTDGVDHNLNQQGRGSGIKRMLRTN